MVYMLLAEGFEETEAIAPIDLMRRAGIEVRTVGVTGKIVPGSHGIGIETDILMEDVELAAAQMVVIPGGHRGVASLRASQPAMDCLKKAWDLGLFVAAICAGPTVLADLQIPDGLQATCYPGCEDRMGSALMVPGAAAVRDGRLITGTSAGCAIPFGLKLVEALKGPEAAETVKQQNVIR